MLATSFVLPKKTILLAIGSFAAKQELEGAVRTLHQLKYKLFGTLGTADYYATHGIPISAVDLQESDDLNIADLLADGRFDLVINLPMRNKVIMWALTFFSSFPFFIFLLLSRPGPFTKVCLRFCCPQIRRPASYVSGGSQLRRGAVAHKVPLITDIKCAKLFVEVLRTVPLGPRASSIDCQASKTVFRLPGFVDGVLPTGTREWVTVSREAAAGGIVAMAASLGQTSLDDLAARAGRWAAEGSCHLTPYVQVEAATVRSQASAHLDADLLVDFSKPTTLSLAALTEVFEVWPRAHLVAARCSAESLPSVLLLAHLFSRRVHIVDVGSVEELQLIRAAKAKEITVTCSVSAPTLATQPLLWQLLGSIDAFSSGGQVALALPLLLTFVAQGRITMDDLVARIYINPCRIFGVAVADETFIEVDLQSQRQLPAASQDLPMHEVVGAVTRVVGGGQLIYLDGKVVCKPGQCQVLRAEHAAPVVVTTPVLKPVPTLQEPPSSPTRAAEEAVQAQARRAQQAVSTPAFLWSPLTVRDELSVSSTVIPHELTGKSILTVQQFTRDQVRFLFNLAHQLRLKPQRDLLKGHVLASIFFEPSTRTSSSFASAMMRLGGSVISITEVSTSSVAKGESLTDSIRTLECYSDVIVLRHFERGSVVQAANATLKPVINAGDGIGEHPTQALLDVFTIREELGTVNGLNITVLGDLKNGRTVHSLTRLLCMYRVKLNFVSPPSLGMPEEILRQLELQGIEYRVYASLEDILPDTDVLYVTRIQKERFASVEEYQAVKGSYVVTPKTMALAKKHMVVMHPLPRIDEISTEVDTDPRAAYFRQMEYGVSLRMALLATVLGKV